MLWRSTLRTIRHSLGRYLAILAIIALGVGFFAGLRVTEKSMIKTADGYLTELNMHDFRLISTLGFTDDDVNAFRKLSGIKKVAGSVSADMIYINRSGSDSVLHAHTLTDGINGLDVIAGRLPEAPYECVFDAKYADESMLGTKIKMSDNNSEETFDKFTYKEYTIVGLCDAANYINFERGTTALAGGSVSGYMYIPADGFSVDYYTEIYLTVNAAGDIYSEEYKSAIDGFRPEIEKLLSERADVRFEKIYGDAKSEVDDAQKELDSKIEELNSARAEIEDNKKKLDSERKNAEAEFGSSEDKLKDARAQLDLSWEQLNQAKADPSAQLPAVAEQLRLAEKKLNESEKEYAANVEALNKAKTEAEEKFLEAENKISEAEKKLDESVPEIDKAQEEIDDAYAEVEKLERAKTYTLDRSSNVGYASFENDTAIVSGVSKVFPLFFFLVAALVCITTMTRMVSEQRTQNGVLKALGYGSAAISGQYLFYAGSASAIGCVIGFFIGSRYLPMALWQVYQIMYSIQRPIRFVADLKLFAICSVVYLICALGATWFVCHRDLNESSAELIRPKAPAPGKRILLERIPFIWKHIKFLHKVSIRNILRYKKRMFMMIIGIGGCTALLLTGFGIRDTIEPVVDNQYDEIELYDAAVSFTSPLDDNSKKLFSEQTGKISSGTMFLNRQNADISLSGGNKTVNLVVFDKELNGFVNLHEGDTELTLPGKDQALVNYRFAHENGIKVGDKIRIISSDLAEINVTVTGIFDNYIYDYVYINSETYSAQTGRLPEYNTAYINFPEGQDANAAGAVLLGADGVATVNLSASMRTRVGNMLKSLDYIVLIVLVCAGALSFIVLYNLTNITITERTREIATLKVLGFYQKEQNSYVFRENIVLTGISAICGIPMGIALLNYVMAQIKISSIYFGCRLAPLSYVFAIAITFVFTITVDLALTSKTKNIDMAQAMKAIE